MYISETSYSMCMPNGLLFDKKLMSYRIAKTGLKRYSAIGVFGGAFCKCMNFSDEVKFAVILLMN